MFFKFQKTNFKKYPLKIQNPLKISEAFFKKSAKLNGILRSFNFLSYLFRIMSILLALNKHTIFMNLAIPSSWTRSVYKYRNYGNSITPKFPSIMLKMTMKFLHINNAIVVWSNRYVYWLYEKCIGKLVTKLKFIWTPIFNKMD